MLRLRRASCRKDDKVREADGVATSRDDAPPFLQSNEDTVTCRRDLAVETRNTVDRRRDERLILEKQALPSRLLARSKEEVSFRVIAKQQGGAALRTSRRVGGPRRVSRSSEFPLT